MRDEVIVKSSGESLEVHITVGRICPFRFLREGISILVVSTCTHVYM